MGGMIGCDEVCLSLLVSSVIRINLLWLMKFQGKGFMTSEFLLGVLSLGR